VDWSCRNGIGVAEQDRIRAWFPSGSGRGSHGPDDRKLRDPFPASELRSLSPMVTAGEWLIGLDIGGTKTAVVAGDRRGGVLHREQFATEPGRGFDDTIAACWRRSRASSHTWGLLRSP